MTQKKNSINDPKVKITIEDDEPDKEITSEKEKEEKEGSKTKKETPRPILENMRVTRSRTKIMLKDNA